MDIISKVIMSLHKHFMVWGAVCL